MADKVTDQLVELRRAAEDGDSDAQGQLGIMLATGQGMEPDPDEAVKWLTRASDQGNITAIFNLGILFEKGIGVSQDENEAAFWFWQAAEQEDVGARMKLGTMLIKGVGFSEGSRVVNAITAAAESGLPYAQAFLGKLYMEGAGLVRDDTSAEKWLRLAAGQGDESGMFNLLELLLEGRTTSTPEDEAAQWFFDLGQRMIEANNLVKAFDCLVSIQRMEPDNFLAKRLEEDIERATDMQKGSKH